MATLSTFLTLLDEFINELMETFPKENKLKTYKTKLELMKKNNPRKVLDMFMENISQFSSKIVNKDETLFSEDVNLIKELKLKELWESGLSENTKDAIWAHLNTLFVFGSTISAIPNDLLKNIEKVAEQCAEGFNNDNANDMLQGMQKMLQQQLKK